MCRASRCCCCIPLRVGLYLSTIYTCVISLLGITWNSFLLARPDDIVQMVRSYTMYNEEEFQELDAYMQQVMYSPYMRHSLVGGLVICCVWFLAAVLLPIALARRQRGLLLPWIVVTWIIVGLETFAMGVYTYVLITGGPSCVIGISMGVVALGIVIHCCAGSGVSSLYSSNFEIGPPGSRVDKLSLPKPDPYADFKYSHLA